MKFNATLLYVLASLGALASCGKDDQVAPAPLAVDKEVTFEVFASKDYSTGYYADHEATINLRIIRTDKESMRETVVFDTTFTKPLKEIPLESNQLIITKKVAGVVVQDEWIGIGSGYRVGAVAYGSYESLQEDQQEKKVEVVL